MNITRKVTLREAPPLVGTEIAVYVSGIPCDLSDGYTFGFTRIPKPAASTHFTIEWGDGSGATYYETRTNLKHTYKRPGLYRIRICDCVNNVAVSASSATIENLVYAPMIREFHTTSTQIITLARTGFSNAYNLEKLELRGSSVRNLAAGTFMGCKALKSLEGCAGIERLFMTVFCDCISLPERVDLPSLISISADADKSPFLGTNIKEFHFAAKNEGTIKALKFYQETGGNLGLEGAVCYFDL